MAEPKYTSAVGQKFNKDGTVRRFPGNTVISRIAPPMPFYDGLVEAQSELKKGSWAGKYAFLPPSSFHMTVIEGVCDQARKPESWPSDLDLSTPIDDVNRFVMERFGPLPLPTQIEMRIQPAKATRWLTIGLVPATEETARALQYFRDEFTLATGIRFPNHDRYKFHITLAYNLIELTPEEEESVSAAMEAAQTRLADRFPRIALDEPRLTFFEDMFRFDDAS